MASNLGYPAEWLERVPAQVFGSLLPGEIRMIIHPGAGLADGGVPMNVPADMVPPELRVPNTLVWIKFSQSHEVLKVWRREPDAAAV